MPSARHRKAVAVLDPRICNITLDANAVDRTPQTTALVDRLLSLRDSEEINFVVPGSVRHQVEHPHTPGHVKDTMLPMIFSLPVEQTAPERETFRKVHALLKGNATSNKHDADARHLCEAAKYGGGYFITHDNRLLKKRGALRAHLGPALCIVTLTEFLNAYDQFVASDPCSPRAQTRRRGT
jgi:predicted nucleic acid-binding protein